MGMQREKGEYHRELIGVKKREGVEIEKKNVNTHHQSRIDWTRERKID